MKRNSRFFKISLVVIIGMVCGFLLSRSVFARANVVGKSMLPTYSTGDNVLVCKILNPDRGDVVVVKESDGKDIIKRIIGMPGDVLQIVDGDVYINGKEYKEDYLYNNNWYKSGIAKNAIVLGKDEYFVLGDNREVSKDSRDIGPVKKNMIIGVVLG